MRRTAIVFAAAASLVPAAAQASTGCTAINGGILNHQTTFNTSAAITSSTAAAVVGTSALSTARSSTWSDGFYGAGYAPDASTFYSFDAGDQIHLSVTVSGYADNGGFGLRSFIRVGTGTTAATEPAGGRVTATANGTFTASYTVASGDQAIGIRDSASGAGGTVTVTVTCTQAAVPPTLNSFTYGSIVAYNPGATTATNIDVATGGSATNAPTSYTVSNASAGTYAASATTTGGGSVTINNSGVASYTPRVGYRGNDTFFARASNSGGNSSPATVTVTVGNPAITASLTGTGAEVGTALAGYAVTPSGGNAPYSCALNSGSAALPAGVTLASNCALTGTPTVPGTYSFNVDITDSSVTGTNGGTASPHTQSNVAVTNFVITQDAPTITSLSPTVGPTFTQNTVVITGTNFVNVTAVSFGATAASSYTVDSATQITALTQSHGATGTVDVQVTTAGGASANTAADNYVFSTVPAAPTIDAPANGATVGTTTPTYSGTASSNVTVTVLVDGSSVGTTTSDGAGNWNHVQPSALTSGAHNVRAFSTNSDGLAGPDSATNTFTVTPAPVASSFTASAVPYNSGSATATTFSVTGHVTNSPTGYAVGSATTAQGGSVSIDASGVVTYLPAASFRGNDSFTYTATNAGGTSAPATVTVPVDNPALSISLAGSGVRGTALSGVQLNTSGGTGPYSCATTLVSGALPAGTALNADCTITGTPTASGTFNFTANVTDSSTGLGPFTQASGTLTLSVAAPTLSISPAAGALPGATIGAAYSETITASGGTAAYSYAVTAGALPAGVTLSTGGVLAGTPTQAGNFSFTITATDSSSAGSGGPYTVSAAYTLAVGAPTIALAPASLPGGTIGAAYSTSVSASGGAAPYSYAVTAGALPTGVTMAADGSFSGTPTAGGTFNFTVTATDSSTGTGAPFTGSRAYAITVSAPTIALSPASLTDATVASAYSAAITASGGTGGYTFAVTGGALPAGLTLASDGTLSGTPTAGGSFSFDVTATDSSTGSGPFTGTRSYTLTVNAPTVTVAPATLPGATVGAAYSESISASGGTAGYSYAVTAGALPAGLTLASNGTLSGTPTAGGAFNFTVTATDSSTGTGAPYTGSRSYSLTVGAPTIVVAPASLPNGAAGAAYSQTITATGGSGSYSFAITAGALPAGLTLASDGTLSGTPTAAGTFNFTVTASDSSTGSGPYTGSRAYSLVIGTPTLDLQPASLPAAAIGTAYSTSVTTSGGTAPYSYSITAGALPAGITMSSGGAFSGTPTAGGTFNFTVTATDSSTGTGAPFTVARAYALTVSAPTLALAPPTLSTGVIGTAYSATISASGGTAGYSYAVTAGALPAGVTLAANGMLSGIPTAGGTFNFTVTATDSSTGSGPYTGSQAYSLTINAPTITLAPTSLPAATPGNPYSEMLTASGGTAPYSFTLHAGSLPAGMVLNSNGTVTGTPTASGTFNFTVRAFDSSTGTGAPYFGERSYTLTVGTPTITIDTASLPNATIATAYSQTLSASGGMAPYNYTVTAGALPTGMTLSSGGVISGAPTAGGSFNFTITASDSSGGSGPFSGSRAFTLVVDAPTITLSPTTLPGATVAASYSQALTASGGTGAYSFAVTAGALPAGMTLAADGTLAGTPTAGGTFNFTVTATDSSTGSGPYTGSRAYSLTVASPTLALAPTTLTDAAVGAAYSESVTASGGTAPYGFAVTAGALPAGVTLASDGTLSGTPTAGGTFNFTVTATDSSTGTGAPYTASRAYSLTVTSAALTIAPATLPGGQMEAAYSQVLSTTGGTAPYSYAVTAGALPSGLTLSASGTLSGTPTVHGSFNLTVTATDSSTGSGPFAGTRAYTLVIATPAAPVAGAVSATVAYNSSANPIALALSGGTATSVAVASAPANGTATATGTSISYTPAAGYFGTDSFTYTATNAGGTSAPATVTITVSTPPAPTAANLSGVTVPYNGGGTAIDLSGSISGVHTSIAIATAPAHGSVSVAGDVVTYTPAADYFGADSFTYTAAGPGGTSAPATVSLTVATPAAPVAADLSGVAIGYNAGPTPIDLAPSITGVHTGIAIGTAPTKGSVAVSGDVVTYTPTTGAIGGDSFTYTATGPGGTSAPATVSLTIATPPAPTVANLSGVAVPYNSGGTAIDLSGSISGVHTSIAVATAPAHGTVSIAGDVVTYTPASGYFGADSFTYAATGPGGTSAPATVSLTVATPPAPSASDRTGITVPYASTGTAIDLAASVSGVHTGVAVATAPAHGTATVQGYIVTYTPAAGYYGPDSFTYTVTGPGGTSAPATVTLTVGTPPAPVASNRSDVAVPHNSSGTPVDLASAISGVYTSVAVATNPAHGTASVSGSVVTYTPATDYYGADSFTYTASGPGGTSGTATVTMAVALPPPPVARSTDASVPGSTTTTNSRLEIDLSNLVDGNATSVQIVTQPEHGTVELVTGGAQNPLAAGGQSPRALGTVTAIYTPAVGYHGEDSFGFVAVGPGGTSAPATVRITVLGVGPVAQDKTAAAGDGETVSVDLTAGATGGPFTGAAVISVAPADAATTEVVASGTGAARSYALRITPAARFDGALVIRYTLSNAFGTSSPATITVAVEARPDPTNDPNVRAVSDAQAESTRRFAQSQIQNFMQRTEALHNGGGGSDPQMGLQLQARDASRTFVEPDRYGEQATRALTDRISGKGGDGLAVDGIAAMRGMSMAEGARNTAAANPAAARQPSEEDEDGGERRVGSIAFWAGGALEIGTQDRTTGRSKITVTSSGLSGGADIKLAEGLVLGVGGGWGIDRSDIDGGAAHVRAANSIVAAYGSFMPVQGMFVDGVVATGDLDFRTRRIVTETGALARGVRDGSMTFGALAVGIDRGSDALQWSAYGRAEWLSAELGTYSETGAGRMNLRFDTRDLESLSSVLGARLGFTQKTSFGTVAPRVRGEWRHEFQDGGVQFLDYADIPGPSAYRITTDGWQRDQFELSLGSTLKLPSAWVFDLELALRGASGARSGTLRAKVSKEF